MTDDFDFEHGTWLVRHRRLLTRLAGSSEWEHFEGTAVCTPILGGVGNLEQNWMPSIGTIGVALRLFETSEQQWSIYWASSTTGRLEAPVVGRFVDGVGTFEGDDHFEGQPIRVRFVWDEITGTTARWTQSFLRERDLAWEVNWVMDFTRHTPDTASSPEPDLANSPR